MITILHSCDVCKETKSPADLVGVKFYHQSRFTLDVAGSTNGTHICKDCLRQIKEQVEKPDNSWREM